MTCRILQTTLVVGCLATSLIAPGITGMPRRKHEAEKHFKHCVFCNISEGSEPSRTVFQNERIIAFHDHSPAAETHLLVCPRKHIQDINALQPSDIELVKEMHAVGSQLLNDIAQGKPQRLGYHIPPFTSVGHLHLHCFGLPFDHLKKIKYMLPHVWQPASTLEQQLEAAARDQHHKEHKHGFQGLFSHCMPSRHQSTSNETKSVSVDASSCTAELQNHNFQTMEDELASLKIS